MLLKGTALAAAGKTAEAERALREARSAAESVGHRRILWEILAGLARIVGDDERAELRTQARQIVETIADTLDRDLKASFVDRPDVRELSTEEP
jgi:hypothetical protein